jgi:hypothetical protein
MNGSCIAGAQPRDQRPLPPVAKAPAGIAQRSIELGAPVPAPSAALPSPDVSVALVLAGTAFVLLLVVAGHAIRRRRGPA